MFEQLTSSFSSLFSRLTGQSHLTEKNIEKVFQSLNDALLDADVPLDVVNTFLDEVKKEVVGQKVATTSLKPGEQFAKIVYDRVLKFLGGMKDYQKEESFSFSLPGRVVVLGLQGSGKTTTLAKLAYYTQQQAAKKGKKVRILLASVDMYRPAAIDQLEILAQQTGCLFYRSKCTSVVEAAQDIVHYAKKEGIDLLLLDTAGRLHVDEQMMEELKKVVAIANPTHKFLVVDAMIGQESLSVAQSFNQAVGFDYAILSKMDSDTRGGVAFAFRFVLQKPILFMGTGEKYDELDRFHPERIARRMIGMGDLQGLVEKAEEKIKAHEKESLERSFARNKLTLEDFAQHIEIMERMGPLENLMKQMPSMPGMSMSPEMIERGQMEMKRFKAIISSMTRKERLYPALLDTSRRQRIARGAGVEPALIKIMLERFEKSQQFVKLFKKLGRLGLG